MNTLHGDTIKTLYHLNVKNKLSDELKKKAISDYRSFRSETSERNILYNIQSIRETEKYLVFNNNFSDFMALNKNTLNLYRTNSSMEDKYLGIRLVNYFPHDGDDNCIMFVVTSNEWIKRRPYDGGDMPENMKREIEKVKQQDYEDNQILVFYKEK